MHRSRLGQYAISICGRFFYKLATRNIFLGFSSLNNAIKYERFKQTVRYTPFWYEKLIYIRIAYTAPIIWLMINDFYWLSTRSDLVDSFRLETTDHQSNEPSQAQTG